MSIGFSLVYPVTCSSYPFFFLLDHFTFRSHIFLPLITSLSMLPPRPSFCGASWAYYQCVCNVFVTGQLGRKESRLMATEILSDSGPVQAVPMGSMCFLPLWNAREHPSTVLIQVQLFKEAPHTEKGWTPSVWVYMWRPSKDCFAIIKKKCIHRSGCWRQYSFYSSEGIREKLVLTGEQVLKKYSLTILFNLWFFLFDSHFPDTLEQPTGMLICEYSILELNSFRLY